MENLVVCNSIFVGHPFHEIRSAAVQAHLVVHEATDYTGGITSPIIEDIRQLRDDVWEQINVWSCSTRPKHPRASNFDMAPKARAKQPAGLTVHAVEEAMEKGLSVQGNWSLKDYLQVFKGTTWKTSPCQSLPGLSQCFDFFKELLLASPTGVTGRHVKTNTKNVLLIL